MNRIIKVLVTLACMTAGILLSAKAGHDYAADQFKSDITQVQVENKQLKDENKKMKGDIETLLETEYQTTLQLLQCKGPGLKLEEVTSK